VPTGDILSGHQPSFYHAGILAKRCALAALADREETGCTWLIVDQDVNEPGWIGYPDLDDRGRLTKRLWRALPTETGVPTCHRRVNTITPPPRVSKKLPGSIQAGLDRMHQAMVEAEGDTVSERVARANERLLGDWFQAPCSLIRASRLFETEHARSLLEHIRAEPIACARLWNEAVREVPRSARELRVNTRTIEETEVPVWSIDPHDGTRRPGLLRDLAEGLQGDRVILPRAFLMTAIVRSAGYRVMIHGTGGGHYESVTDQWAREFLGLELAPIMVVSATVTLPIEEFVPDASLLPAPGALRRMEHDPWSDATHKRGLVEAITKAPRGSALRRRLYAELHETRLQQAASISSRIEELRHATEDLGEAMKSRDLARDRTWAWPLHESRGLRDMLAAGP
jgi:hypothetical protein